MLIQYMKSVFHYFIFTNVHIVATLFVCMVTSIKCVGKYNYQIFCSCLCFFINDLMRQLLINFRIIVPVPLVTSFHSFLRPHSEHSFHSVTSGTTHKSKCFISLRSSCLRTDLAMLHSAFTLVFACPDK